MVSEIGLFLSTKLVELVLFGDELHGETYNCKKYLPNSTTRDFLKK
jgi:hypothetical protein